MHLSLVRLLTGVCNYCVLVFSHRVFWMRGGRRVAHGRFPPRCRWSLQPGAGSFTERRFSVLTKPTFSALSSCAHALREVQKLLSKPSCWERFSAVFLQQRLWSRIFFSLAHQGWVIPVDCGAPNSLWFPAQRCWAGRVLVPCAAVSAGRGVSEALGRLGCPTCSVLAPQRAGV